MRAGEPRGWAAGAILLLAYTASVSWLFLSAPEGIVPLFPDEGQYSVIAQNLLRSGEFLLRGDLPRLRPPLYPAFLATGSLLLPSLEWTTSARLLNALAMSAAIFPCYGIARQLGLPGVPSLLAAMAAGWLPNVVLAAQFMSECLYYPLFLAVVWTGLRWTNRMSAGSAAAVGGCLGAGLLAKYTFGVVYLAWILFLVVAWVRSLVRSQPTRPILTGAICSLGVATSIVFPWYWLLATRLGPVPLEIIVSYRPGGPPPLGSGWIFTTWPGHAASLFLGAGLISLIPFLIGLPGVHRRNPFAALWVSSLVLGVSAATAFFNDRFLGQLDDRYMFPLMPLIVVTATLGLQDSGSRILRFGWTGVAIAVLLATLALPPPPANPLVQVPWIYGFVRSPTEAFSWNLPLDQAILVRNVAIAAFALSLLWFAPPRRRASMFTAAVLLLWFVQAISGLNGITRWGERADPLRFARWLREHVGAEARLVVVGPRERFEIPRQQPEDPKIRQWGRTFGLDERRILAAEAVDRHDVRRVSRLDQLSSVAAKSHAEYVLSPVPFANRTPLARFGGTGLYRVPRKSVDWTLAPNAVFLLGDLRPDGARWGRHAPTGLEGWVLPSGSALGTTGNGVFLPKGRYDLYVCVRPARPDWRGRLQIRGASSRLLVDRRIGRWNSPPRTPVTTFETTAAGFHEIHLAIAKGDVFLCGVQILPPETESASPGQNLRLRGARRSEIQRS